MDRLGDLSLKRNLGLLLARRLGWRTVLFLDDDIYGIDSAVVQRASATLGRNVSSVGLPVIDFPDNSVVCHANRLSGGKQEVFVGGAALLIDSASIGSFFPDIYNEDWLFLYDAIAARKVAAGAGVHQQTYQPFGSSQRAEAEEFGDVLAEGLFGLLQDRRQTAEAASPAYWQRFLACRASFIEGVALRLHYMFGVEDTEPALLSLAAAEQRRSTLTPGLLAAYYRTWRLDVRLWAERLDTLTRATSIDQAISDFSLQAEMHVQCPISKLGRSTLIDQSCEAAAAPLSARIAATAQLDVPGRLLQEGFWEGIKGPTSVGAGCDVGHFCVVGQGVTLGAGTILDTYCLVESGVTIGENTLLTHRALVGFRASVGADCVIGGFVCERSAVGRSCRVFGALVHRQIDPSLPWDAPEAEEPSPRLEDGVFIGWGAAVVGGVVVGASAYVCAGATVTRDVPAGWIVTGVNEMRPPERWGGELGEVSPFFHGRDG